MFEIKLSVIPEVNVVDCDPVAYDDEGEGKEEEKEPFVAADESAATGTASTRKRRLSSLIIICIFQ